MMQSTDKLDPSIEFIPGIGISAINPRGCGDSVPRRNVLSFVIDSLRALFSLVGLAA